MPIFYALNGSILHETVIPVGAPASIAGDNMAALQIYLNYVTG
jgi:hypothetical protein